MFGQNVGGKPVYIYIYIYRNMLKSLRTSRPCAPKGPFHTKNAIDMEIVVFCYRGSSLLSIPSLLSFFPGKTASNEMKKRRTTTICVPSLS